MSDLLLTEETRDRGEYRPIESRPMSRAELSAWLADRVIPEDAMPPPLDLDKAAGACTVEQEPPCTPQGRAVDRRLITDWLDRQT